MRARASHSPARLVDEVNLSLGFKVEEDLGAGRSDMPTQGTHPLPPPLSTGRCAVLIGEVEDHGS